MKLQDKHGKKFVMPNRCSECRKWERECKEKSVCYKCEEPWAKGHKCASESVTEKSAAQAEPTTILTNPFADAKFIQVQAKPTTPKQSADVVAYQRKTDWEKRDLVDKCKANAINAASATIDVTCAESVGAVKAYPKDGKAPIVLTGVAVGTAGNARISTAWHGPKWFRESPDFWSGPFLNKRDTLRNSNSEHISRATQVGALDLCWWPAPSPIKPLPLALPVKNETVTLLVASEGRTIKGKSGIIIAEGHEQDYVGICDEDLKQPGLWTATYSSVGGYSGGPIVNAKAQVVGWHISSRSAPNSPAHFQPVTPEIIEEFNKPLPKNF